MAEHFNGLMPAEAERLALLLEELGEAQQAIGKILRHGYESSWNGGPTNRASLQHELGDVAAAVTLLVDAGDLVNDDIRNCTAAKLTRVRRFLHHQTEPALPAGTESPDA